jgi:Tfp pilus assembly protein PilO
VAFHISFAAKAYLFDGRTLRMVVVIIIITIIILFFTFYVMIHQQLEPIAHLAQHKQKVKENIAYIGEINIFV